MLRRRVDDAVAKAAQIADQAALADEAAADAGRVAKAAVENATANEIAAGKAATEKAAAEKAAVEKAAAADKAAADKIAAEKSDSTEKPLSSEEKAKLGNILFLCFFFSISCAVHDVSQLDWKFHRRVLQHMAPELYKKVVKIFFFSCFGISNTGLELDVNA
jgi:hypothetical protein